MLELVDSVNGRRPEELIDEVNEFAGMDRHHHIALKAAALRRFNRFYFRQMRPLREAMTGPGMQASHLRVMREIGEAPHGTTAARIAGTLSMDPGRLSRILAWFRALGHLTETRVSEDGRMKLIELSRAGRECYGRLQRSADCTAEFMLLLLTPDERERLIAAMTSIETILRRARWDAICPSSDRGCG